MRDGLCGELREDLSAYVDDELGADARAHLEGHLRGCEECRGELERLRKLVRLVSSVPREEPPAGLREKISARVREERRPRRFVLRMPWWVTSSAAAAALVGVVALAGVLRTPLERAPARREAPAAVRPGEAAEEAAPMAARDADKTLAFEAKKKALPPAPPARAPEPALRKARARRVEEPSPTPAEERPGVAVEYRALTPEEAKLVDRLERGGHLTFGPLPGEEAAAPARPLAARPAERLEPEEAVRFLKLDEENARNDLARRRAKRAEEDELSFRAGGLAEGAKRGKGKETGARGALARTAKPSGPAPPPAATAARREEKRATALAEGYERKGFPVLGKDREGAAPPAPAEPEPPAEEEEPGLKIEVVVDSFEEALVLVRKAAKKAGGELLSSDKAALELVCLVPGGALGSFAEAVSPLVLRGQAGEERRRAKKVEAKLARAELEEKDEKRAEEAEPEPLVRVMVRVTLR